ncbi:hypothetical protein CAC42_7913 [Sphaceloma murrayae]|uniref:LIM zinc-binding domain-containing protein n=1 Tax=Sphaceloma murrayae TaxID=2082308 RepID=A0A2K1QY10_9PEZI|nr:hypothetical protein CAC42_7913 [Sphaceloma murrayae]
MLAKARAARTSDAEAGNYMSDDKLAEYLADLRTSRAARLNGSRPAPTTQSAEQKSPEKLKLARDSNTQYAGRPLVPAPLRFNSPIPSEAKEVNPLKPSSRLVNEAEGTYPEDEARWKEKKEARSLRMALEDTDLEEERRIHEAAQNEASELVLEHRSPSKKSEMSAYANPDAPVRDSRIHIRKGSYGRCHSPKPHQGGPLAKDARVEPDIRKDRAPFGPAPSAFAPKHMHESMDLQNTTNSGNLPGSIQSPKKKSYQGLANAVAADIATIKRRVSSGSKRKASSEKRMFPTAEERIYEEPETIKEEEVEEPVKKCPPPPVPSVSEDSNGTDIPRHMRKNPFARVRFNKDNLERANSIASGQVPKFNPVEIQRNAPSQSRRPWYMSNKPASAPAVPQSITVEAKTGADEGRTSNEEKEIRSEDIRAATSMKRKDRSTNLPQPTAVSDSPGRPIVSFTNGWKEKEAERRGSGSPIPGSRPMPRPNSAMSTPASSTPMKNQASRPQAAIPPVRTPTLTQQSQRPSGPSMFQPQVSIPNGIPILNLPDDDDGTKSKVLSEEPELPHMNLLQTQQQPSQGISPHPPRKTQSVPIINVPDLAIHPTRSERQPSARPLPVPQQGGRPLPDRRSQINQGARSAPLPIPHLTPTQQKSSVLCAQCALPIAGRILSAAGERFHPECFACHQCGINLECVAFYPEPDQKYYERIARIQQRLQGFEIAMPEGVTDEDVRRLEEQDGDESLRFFCHLDFHETFSPRCRSCRTPIEGEVVVACGAEWHVGHFFCAQCGDPFDSTTPFVEKEGYAWCLGCHTHRYSPKCKKCRKPITDVVVNALDNDWHGDCFCCSECGGGFDDGQYFLRGDSIDPVYELAQQSASSAPTGGPAARYFTPALFPSRIDSVDRTLDRQPFFRDRSESITSESYYTAAWNTPNDPSPQSTARRPHTSGRDSTSTKRVSSGFVFGLDHLVPSRLPKSLFGDLIDGPISPTVAKQLRTSQKLSEHTSNLFGDYQDFLTQARGVPADKNPKQQGSADMLASRWAPTPDRELHGKSMAEKPPQEPSQSPKTAASSQTKDSPRPQSIRTGSLESTKESPRKKKKVLWNGRQCVIYLPFGPPEKFGGARPMSLTQVENLMRGWQASGHDTNGFDVQHTDIPEIEADRGRLRYAEAQDLFTVPAGSRPPVRIADPKAWKDYENWLMEEKLRALGVGGLDDPPPASREVPAQQPSRTFSPPFNGSLPGSLGFPFSQRSTPGLSNFSSGPHSRTMSIASPLSSGTETRGHAHRHSVFGMPQAFQQLTNMSPTMRPFSPSQQLSLNAVARATSPGIDRLKTSVSPVPQGQPIDGQPFRPSPVGERRFTPPTHLRHQSLAPAFSPQPVPATVTPHRPALAEVREDEEEDPRDFTPRAQIQQSDIVVPTPRGHRHNISENLEKEIRDAEKILEQGNAWETHNQFQPAQHTPFSQFQAPGQDFASFTPAARGPSQSQFGAPQNVPAFQPQAFVFQPQAPYAQPAFTPNQSTFKPQAPTFSFNPGLAAHAPAFQPGPMTNTFAQPLSRPGPNQLGHNRQQSSGNLDVTAPAFKPQSFGVPGPISSSGFNFSAEFKPGAQAFQPGKPFSSEDNSKSIFGDVKIPEVVKPARRSKAVAIVRPVSSHKSDGVEAVEEDESGRLVQSSDRQKRAFRAAEDDGDTVPLFAARPESPAWPNPTAQSPALIKIASDEEISEGEAPDDSGMAINEPAEKDALDAAAELAALGYSTDEDKENAPVQGTSKAITGRSNSHARNLSSLSALAKPFEFAPRAQPAQESPIQMPAGQSENVSDGKITSIPDKPDFSPDRIFSRDATSIDGGLSNALEPKKSVPSPLREPTPQPAEISIEPSFDEIDAVMRQLNEENDCDRIYDSKETSDDKERDVEPLRESSPSALISQLEDLRSDAPSPGSVQIHQVLHDRSRSVSPMSEKAHLDISTPLEMPSPMMQGPRNRNLGPSSEWSEDFSSGAADRIRQRSGFFDDRVDEAISKAFKEHLQPLQEQMEILRRSISEGRPNTAEARSRRPVSSGMDSDADDEDDVMDSKFLARPLSSRGGRKYDLIKAAVTEAMSHRPASPIKESHADLLNGFEMVNSRLDTLLVKGFELDDVRDAVADAMHKSSTSMVHVPQPDSSDSELEYLKQQRQENFDNKKLLRLAEEELDLLRASIATKDNRLDALERERGDLRDRAEDSEEVAANLGRKVKDLEAESVTLHGTLEEYRALRLKLKYDHEDAAAENRQLRATMVELEGQIADGKNVRDNMRDKLDRIHTDMAGAAMQLANQKVVWQRQNEDLQKRCAVYQTRLDSELQLRTGLENELSRLRMLVSEGDSAKAQLEHNNKSSALLEETIASLRDEVNELQTGNSRVHRELQDARENSRLEVQRAQLMMQAGVETANNQADAMQAGLQSKLSITANELENMKALMEAMKSRHEVLLQEEADLRRDTLFKVNEASSAALESLRARHEEDIHFLKTQHDRALAEVKHDAQRSESFWNERLTMSEERHVHLKERIAHLEERLTIAKSAASAAAQAAQAASKATPTVSEPERISPQALRESILVLQEQLQDRESRIEQLQSSLTSTNNSLPQKLKEKEIEATWLRELLAVRADDLAELIATLEKEDFDRERVRDAAIRIQTQLRIETAEKERFAKAGDSLPAQAMAGVVNFASPKAVQLAAAIGNWRARGAPSVPSPRRGREMKSFSQGQRNTDGGSGGHKTASPVMGPAADETPSKSNPPRPGSAASWMSGLMTPPASGLRRTPSPAFESGDVKGKGRVVSRFGSESPDAEGRMSFGGEGFDEDAEIVGGRSLASELEPLG